MQELFASYLILWNTLLANVAWPFLPKKLGSKGLVPSVVI